MRITLLVGKLSYYVCMLEGRYIVAGVGRYFFLPIRTLDAHKKFWANLIRKCEKQDTLALEMIKSTLEVQCFGI